MKAKTDRRNSVELLRDGRKFEIKFVERLSGPVLHDVGTGAYGGNNIRLSLCNYGWPAQVIAIENLEGSVNWSEDLPKPAPTAQSLRSPSFTISGVGYKKDQKYKFKLVLLDSLNRTHAYIIEGHNLTKSIQKLWYSSVLTQNNALPPDSEAGRFV